MTSTSLQQCDSNATNNMVMRLQVSVGSMMKRPQPPPKLPWRSSGPSAR